MVHKRKTGHNLRKLWLNICPIDFILSLFSRKFIYDPNFSNLPWNDSLWPVLMPWEIPGMPGDPAAYDNKMTPEPGTLALLGLGFLTILLKKAYNRLSRRAE